MTNTKELLVGIFLSIIIFICVLILFARINMLEEENNEIKTSAKIEQIQLVNEKENIEKEFNSLKEEKEELSTYVSELEDDIDFNRHSNDVIEAEEAPIKINEYDRDILARMIAAESNMNYDMMLAIGQVILNRADIFGFTIEETLFEKGVFTPITDGRYYSIDVSDKATQAATELLQGYIYEPVGNSTLFCTTASYNRGNWHSYANGRTIEFVLQIDNTMFFSESK